MLQFEDPVCSVAADGYSVTCLVAMRPFFLGRESSARPCAACQETVEVARVLCAVRDGDLAANKG